MRAVKVISGIETLQIHQTGFISFMIFLSVKSFPQIKLCSRRGARRTLLVRLLIRWEIETSAVDCSPQKLWLVFSDGLHLKF